MQVITIDCIKKDITKLYIIKLKSISCDMYTQSSLLLTLPDVVCWTVDGLHESHILLSVYQKADKTDSKNVTLRRSSSLFTLLYLLMIGS